jgi:phage N-6-adenine-methyltransferase
MSSLSGQRRPAGLSNSDEWRTPDRLFNACSDHYGPFTLDAAAAKWNARCEKYFTMRRSAFAGGGWWRGRVWCNPPYSRGNLLKWVGQARRNILAFPHAELVCCLVPAYTSERWWQQHVLGAGPGRARAERVVRAGIGTGYRTEYDDGRVDLVVEVVFVEGRLRFRHETGVQDSARHPSAVVVFSRKELS